jgi:Flp pilus assembly protein TadG
LKRLRARLASKLARAQDGTTILEFGLIAPMLMVLLFGALDVGHTLYMQSVLNGSVQKAARDGTLETAAGTSAVTRETIDDAVRNQLGFLHNEATVTITRRFYKTFSKAKAAEAEQQLTDSVPAPGAPPNPYNDGKCNNGETYVDANNNGRFDRDGGDSVDKAGARDNVVYTVNVHYPRMFPLDKLVGGSGTTSLTARTVLSNQPFGAQAQYAAPTNRQCGTGTPGNDQPAPDPPPAPPT